MTKASIHVADPLVPAREVSKELGKSSVTLWRMERDGILPRAHRIRGRKSWLRSEIDKLKADAATPGGIEPPHTMVSA